MQKLLLLFLFGCLLMGCSLVHKMDIEQGNVYTPDMAAKLHPGMTLTQVKNVMGNPVLLNTFSDNRVTYVYTNMPGNQTMQEKYLTLTFQQGVLKSITRSD